jgi:hypothetical protein
VTATGSTLLAVLILLAMVPPGAGVAASAVACDATIELVHRSAGESGRREHKSSRLVQRTMRSLLSEQNHLQHGWAAWALPSISPDVRPAASPPRDVETCDAAPHRVLVIEALLALPPPVV